MHPGRASRLALWRAEAVMAGHQAYVLRIDRASALHQPRTRCSSRKRETWRLTWRETSRDSGRNLSQAGPEMGARLCLTRFPTFMCMGRVPPECPIRPRHGFQGLWAVRPKGSEMLIILCPTSLSHGRPNPAVFQRREVVEAPATLASPRVRVCRPGVI